MGTTEKKLYILGIGISILVFVVWVLSLFTPFSLKNIVPPCMLHQLTGLYCPGCGGTRAVMALIKGRCLSSFFYHPVVLYSFLLAAYFMITNSIQLVLRNKWNIGMKYKDRYLYLLVGLILGNWVIQNIFILAGHPIAGLIMALQLE